MRPDNRRSNRSVGRNFALCLGLLSLTARPSAGVDPRLEWDGVLNEQVKLLASDGAEGDAFGGGIAMDGDTLAIAAPLEDGSGASTGAVYVFIRQGGTWSEAAKLVATAVVDSLGTGLAVEGDVVFAADFHDQGAVHVFERPPGGWSGTVNEVATLLPADADAFGRAIVAAEGDSVFVGSWTPTEGIGTIYVYEQPPGGWSGTVNEVAELRQSDTVPGELFPTLLSASGDTVVAGCGGCDDNGPLSGAAYVFETPVGGWTGIVNESAKLLPSLGMSDDFFGGRLAASESTVIVGSGGDASLAGAAYVYEEPAGGWSGTLTEDARLEPSDLAADDRFGPVAIDGETVLGGSWGDADNGAFSGSAYIFERPAGGWSGTVGESAKLLASDGVTGDVLGERGVIEGQTVVLTARGHDQNGDLAGAAYVFEDILMFSDGFESGDTSAWSVTVP